MQDKKKIDYDSGDDDDIPQKIINLLPTAARLDIRHGGCNSYNHSNLVLNMQIEKSLNYDVDERLLKLSVFSVAISVTEL